MDTTKRNNRRIVIGDVHGHYDALQVLLEGVAPGDDDEIYFLGDLIDRGPKSAEVVDFVYKNNYQCLRGNHEEMLLDVFGEEEIYQEMLAPWLYNGGHTTVLSYDKKIPLEHIRWMRNLPNYLDLGDYWLVHAGLNPKKIISEQTSEEFCWIREKFHSIEKPYFEDKLIIIGHTITFTFPGVKPGQLAAGVGWLGIDTGVYHPNSGWLSALELDESKVYQVNTKNLSLRVRPLSEAITKVNTKNPTSKRLLKQI